MCCVIVLILLIAVYSRPCTAAVIEGLRLCGSAVIPALFPMFVGTKLLTGLLKELQLPKGFLRLWQRLFGVSGVCSYGFLFGLLGGYPLGAAVISELYGGKSISKADAEQSLRFCNNSGPGFFLAALGVTVLHSAKAGIKYGCFRGEDRYTTDLSDRLLRLPLYQSLSEEECARVIDEVHNFFHK